MAQQPKAKAEDIIQEVVGTVGLATVNLNAPVKSISQVLDEINPQGQRCKLADFVNQEIVIWGVNPFKGQFGPAAYVIFTDKDNIMYNTVAGQTVVLPKLLMVMNSLPVSARVVEVSGGMYGSYFDLE